MKVSPQLLILLMALSVLSSCGWVKGEITFPNKLSSSSASPITVSLFSPLSNVSIDDTPEFLVSGLISGDSVELFSDSSCTLSLGSESLTSGSSVNVLTTQLPSPSVNQIYAVVWNNGSQRISCLDLMIRYEVVANGLSFNAISGAATTGAPLSTQPVVHVLDQSNNLVNSASGTVTLNGYSDVNCQNLVAGGLDNSTNTATLASGIANFAGVIVNNVTVASIGAASPGFGPACSPVTSSLPINPPTISYATSTGTTGSFGVAMLVTPSTLITNGAAITNCTAAPALPAWASISATTCVISGTPNTPIASISYTITATNSAGTSTAPVTLTVAAPSPAVSYVGSTGTTGVDTIAMSITPTTLAAGTSASVASCALDSSSPALPTGLSVNNSSCVISGTPTQVKALTTYTILLTNSFGATAAATVGLEVLANTPLTFASITVSNTNPTKTQTYNLTYGATSTYTDYCLLENDTTITNCSWTAGVLPATYSVTGAENAKVISGWIRDSLGRKSARVDSNSVTLDLTAPTTPSSLSLISPASSPGTSATPTIRVSGVVIGNTIELFTDSSCILLALKGSGTAAGTTIDITSSSLSLGDNLPYYARATDLAGNASSCSVATVTYRYVSLPTLSFASATGTSGATGVTMTVTPTTLSAGSGASVSSCAIKGGTTALPAGLNIHNTTCVISGIPSSAASLATYTILVTNSFSQTAEATVDLEVISNLALASVTVTNSNPTNSTTFNLTYGTVTGSYTHYCILENNTTQASCAWVAGTLPATKVVGSTEEAKVLSIWIRDVSLNVSTRVDSSSVTLSETGAPQAASSLAWSISSPSSSKSLSFSWTKSTSWDLTSQAVDIYSTADCSGAVTTTQTLSSSAQSSTYAGTHYTTYTFKVRSIDTQALSTSSACSSSMLVRPLATIVKAVGQAASTTSMPVSFTITFSETIDAASLGAYQIENSGTATGLEWEVIGDCSVDYCDGTAVSQTLRVRSVTTAGTVIPVLRASEVLTAEDGAVFPTATGETITYTGTVGYNTTDPLSSNFVTAYGTIVAANGSLYMLSRKTIGGCYSLTNYCTGFSSADTDPNTFTGLIYKYNSGLGQFRPIVPAGVRLPHFARLNQSVFDSNDYGTLTAIENNGKIYIFMPYSPDGLGGLGKVYIYDPSIGAEGTLTQASDYNTLHLSGIPVSVGATIYFFPDGLSRYGSYNTAAGTSKTFNGTGQMPLMQNQLAVSSGLTIDYSQIFPNKNGTLVSDGTNVYALGSGNLSGLYKFMPATKAWGALNPTGAATYTYPGITAFGYLTTSFGSEIVAVISGDFDCSNPFNLGDCLHPFGGGMYAYSIGSNTWTLRNNTVGGIGWFAQSTVSGQYIYSAPEINRWRTFGVDMVNPATYDYVNYVQKIDANNTTSSFITIQY